MEESRKSFLLSEWVTISQRMEHIDARIWQGAGILLVISIGGFSFFGWNPPKTLFDFIAGIVVAIISIIILLIWRKIYTRWIYFQSTFGHRAREIEQILDLRMNFYTRSIEYWETRPDTKAYLNDLREHDREAFNRLEDLYKKQSKNKVGRTKIRTSLGWLTWLLICLWVIVIITYTLVFIYPTLYCLTYP